MSTSSPASREQELQEQRKRGRAGASTARSSTARQTQAFVTTSWQDLAIAPGHSHARYARALGRLEVGVSSRVSKTSQELPMPSKALPRASKKLPRASERLQDAGPRTLLSAKRIEYLCHNDISSSTGLDISFRTCPKLTILNRFHPVTPTLRVSHPKGWLP